MQYTNGLDNFDIVYFINLEHREDRRRHIEDELKKTNISPDKINRIDAVYNKNFGIIGACKSHCLALEKFIESGKETCIIFEDDFEFSQSQDTIHELINHFFNKVKEFDVLMLASNTFKQLHDEAYPFITKILNAQTMSGYAISKKFAPILLQSNQESMRILEPIGHPVHEYCFDIYMKRLQPGSQWYCINPKIGKQTASFSDIEQKDVNYGV